MANEISIFDQPNAALPAHIKAFLGDNSNIADKTTVPSLSYEGKVWTVSLHGEKTKLMKRDAEGDEIPVSVFRAVILGFAPKRGRTYYEGAYDPAKVGVPICWSDNGVTPDATIAEPQAKSCDGCPMSIKGSKVTEQGKAIAACSQHRMLVVVPANNLTFEPLRLKIAMTSDWDKQSPDLEAQQWFAFSNLLDFIKARGINHTATFSVKMKFDPNVAYPKVIFSPDRILTAEELAITGPLSSSQQVKDLVVGKFTLTGADGVQKAITQAEPAKDVEEGPTKEERAAAAAAVLAEEEAAKKAAAKAKREAAAAKKAEEEAAAAAAKKLAIVADDDDDVALPGAKTEDKPAAAGISPDVAALLAEWGDD